MGSNLCVPRHYLRVLLNRDGRMLPNLGADYVAGVIATRPREVEVPAIDAEVAAYTLLGLILDSVPSSTNNSWLQRLRTAAERKRVILRTLLCRGGQYVKHLNEIKDWHGRGIEHALSAELSAELGEDWHWMVEISVPDLFPVSLRKVGEILLSTKAYPNDMPNYPEFKLARLPGNFVRLPRQSEELKFDYTPSPMTDHIQIYGCEAKNLIIDPD